MIGMIKNFFLDILTNEETMLRNLSCKTSHSDSIQRQTNFLGKVIGTKKHKEHLERVRLDYFKLLTVIRKK
jgi:hypothetical protein